MCIYAFAECKGVPCANARKTGKGRPSGPEGGRGYGEGDRFAGRLADEDVARLDFGEQEAGLLEGPLHLEGTVADFEDLRADGERLRQAHGLEVFGLAMSQRHGPFRVSEPLGR